MAGLVGSSNNPVSGITIATVLFFGLLISFLGATGVQAVFMTIIVGAFVCSAAAVSGDNLQDLKTGDIIGAVPYKQQLMQIVGVLLGALVIPPVLEILSKSSVIGSEAFPAPQASLVAAITEGVFSKELPWDFVIIGAAIAVITIIYNQFSSRKIPVLALAVGTYLPFYLGSTILLGALFSIKPKPNGVLIASGLICGEALLGF